MAREGDERRKERERDSGCESEQCLGVRCWVASREGSESLAAHVRRSRHPNTRSAPLASLSLLSSCASCASRVPRTPTALTPRRLLYFASPLIFCFLFRLRFSLAALPYLSMTGVAFVQRVLQQRERVWGFCLRASTTTTTDGGSISRAHLLPHLSRWDADQVRFGSSGSIRVRRSISRTGSLEGAYLACAWYRSLSSSNSFVRDATF